jgi:hypothetical protein
MKSGAGAEQCGAHAEPRSRGGLLARGQWRDHWVVRWEGCEYATAGKKSRGIGSWQLQDSVRNEVGWLQERGTYKCQSRGAWSDLAAG